MTLPCGPIGRISLIGLIGLAAAAVALAKFRPAGAEPTFDVLIFSRTTGFRHDSIEDGIAAIEALGAANGFRVEATEDPSRFTDPDLAAFAVVVFLNTTGDVLDDPRQEAFMRFVRSGGGFVGVHSASDTEHGWPWYGELLGAFFAGHPPVQEATIHVENRTHPSTADLPAQWVRTDEWYNFDRNPRLNVQVLATLDESTYSGGTMGADHPIAWYHEFEGGRSWYTAGGHTLASYAEEPFRGHLLGGILWAAGGADQPADIAVRRWRDYP